MRVLESLRENINGNHFRVTLLGKFPDEIIYELRMKMESENEEVKQIRIHLEQTIFAREINAKMNTTKIIGERTNGRKDRLMIIKNILDL